MANLFSSINLEVPASVNSTIDLKLLDSACAHPILNEVLTLNASDLFAGVVYSGGNQYNQNNVNYSSLDPDAFVVVTTKNPFINNSSVEFFEISSSSFDTPITETFTVPDSLNTRIQLSFPPVPNTVSAQLVLQFTDTDNEIETVYYPFTNYILYQLLGYVQFTSTVDIGSNILFTYVGDKRKILPKNKILEPNWELLGYDSKGRGIFKVYGRAFVSNTSGLEIRYNTNISSCPRCGGAGIVNDLDISPATNRFYSVFDFSKLIQDFFKRFLTRKGTSPFDPTEGTQIPIFIGIGKANPLFIDTMARTEIIVLLDNIRAKQAVQASIQGISLAEQIQQINYVNVARINATDVNMDISVQSRSGVTSQIQIPIRGN